MDQVKTNDYALMTTLAASLCDKGVDVTRIECAAQMDVAPFWEYFGGKTAAVQTGTGRNLIVAGDGTRYYSDGSKLALEAWAKSAEGGGEA